VSFRVRCVAATAGTLPGTCAVRLSLANPLGGKALAKRSIALKSGTFQTVRLRLGARALRRLREHSIVTRLSAAVANPGGAPRKASRAVRIVRTARR
jgi:hypothetical protein